MESELTSLWPAIWMIAAAFCFATMGALTHEVGAQCDWLLIALIRVLCSFLLAVAMSWSAGARLVLCSPRSLWVRSIAGTISLVCTFNALTRLPVADVLTLTNTYPIWIVLFTLLSGNRQGSWMDVILVSSGVFGVAIIQRPYMSGRGDSAVLVALLGSFTTAIAMLGLHRLRTVDPRAVVAHFSGLATLVVTAWFLLRQPAIPLDFIDRAAVVRLLGVGLSGTMGQVLLTKAFAAGPPARIAVLSLTQVLFAMIYDVAIAGRILGADTIAGFLLVLIPSAWITIRAGRSTQVPDVLSET